MTQKEALDILKTGANVFLTGAAGSGKTHVLNAYISYLKKNGVEAGVTASTGIAATHMGGVTIHSWTGLGIRDALTPADIAALAEKDYIRKRFDRTRVLVIDEVSMLHHFRLDMVDRLAREMRRDQRPFGGMQVVLCGDFFQLPPVARQGEPEPHFVYKSDAWRDMGLKVCYLEEQHRQTDDSLLEILNAIRGNDVSDDVYEHLKSCHLRELREGLVPTRLFTHNVDVDRINMNELSSIGGDEKAFLMTSRGREPLVEALKKTCLAPERLVVKEGARVMFVKNNFDAGYVNGTLGVVSGFDEKGTPLVTKLDGETVPAEVATWGIEEEGKVKAEVSQIPLRLAWAITVHKSQGMSLDAVEVDLSRSFVAGMGYVALSRARTIAGLRLLGLNDTALAINEEVIEYDRELRDRSRDEAGRLTAAELKKLQAEFIEKNAGTLKKEKIPSHEVTRAHIAERLSLSEIAAKRGIKEETVIDHIERLVAEGADVDISHMRPAKELLRKIKDAFKKAGDGRLTSAKAHAGRDVSFTDLKLARLFLDKLDKEK